MRFGELVAIEISDIDFTERYLTVRHNYVLGEVKAPKSGKSRTVPLSPEFVLLLKGWIANRENQQSPLLFCRKDGTYIDYRYVYPFIRDAFKGAGLEGAQKWHRLRRTFASNLIWADETIYSVQKLMGHSTVAITERYIGKPQAVNHGAAAKLELIYSSQ